VIYLILFSAQPYMLSSMKLRLWDGDERSYRYFIETSIDKSNWKMAADRRNEDCKSWQILQFDQRPVVYISITGTHNTANNVSFKCLILAEKLFYLKIYRDSSIVYIWSVPFPLTTNKMLIIKLLQGYSLKMTSLTR
jgi:hypothetical protein